MMKSCSFSILFNINQKGFFSMVFSKWLKLLKVDIYLNYQHSNFGYRVVSKIIVEAEALKHLLWQFLGKKIDKSLYMLQQTSLQPLAVSWNVLHKLQVKELQD